MELLTQAHMEVILACNGQEALDVLAQDLHLMVCWSNADHG
jgi:hypothetical protein